MELCISIAFSRFPLRRLWEVRNRGTAGIRGGCGHGKADGSMDARQAAVLLLVLLLVTDRSHAEGPGSRDGGDVRCTPKGRKLVCHQTPLPCSSK